MSAIAGPSNLLVEHPFSSFNAVRDQPSAKSKRHHLYGQNSALPARVQLPIEGVGRCS